MINSSDVINALRGVMDPELGRDIVSLGFVKNVNVDGGQVRFTLELTSPACPMKQAFREACEEKVRALPGVEAVTVDVTARKPGHQQIPAGTLAGVDAIVAVSSCKGGVGKSTVAAHLARALQRKGHSVGLLDADIYGPSSPTLFNLHNIDVYAVDNKIQPVEVHNMKVMSLGFLIGDSPAVMRGPMVSNYISQILTQTDWGNLDYLIIDMPPGTGDTQLTITQAASLDGAIIVTTAQALSLVDVAKGILMFEKVNVPVLGVVHNMSYFECDNCGKRHHIFGAASHTLEERFGLETLVELPIIDNISTLAGAEAGSDIPAMDELAGKLHKSVCRQRAEKPNRPEVTFDAEAIHVKWPDGDESTLPNAFVRSACRCASCVDERTGRQLLDPDQIPPDIHPESVTPLGNYAVAVSWSDGHKSGIYAWDYLRELADNQSNKT